MNFLRALQHAFIGYGIRRTGWEEYAILYYDVNHADLRYIRSDSPATISNLDFHATDWETV